MTRPLRIQYPGAFYHVTNRGNERKAIFKDDKDRYTFIDLLSRSLEVYSVNLYSFVLMNNHFHLLVETPLGNLSQFMRHFNISYTSAFNRRHHRTGHLYQGRYKSVLIDSDTYLSMVSRYIHLNPVKVGRIKMMPVSEQLKQLWNYKWSSLPGYVSQEERWGFIDYTVGLEDFGGDTPQGRNSYKKQITTDLEEELPIKEHIVAQSVLGNDDFVQRIKSTYLDSKSHREQPALAKVHKYVAEDVIIDIVCKISGESRDRLLRKTCPLRQMTMDLLYRLGGLTNPEIGKLLGLDYSTISQGRKRFRQRIEKDEEMRALHSKIEEIFKDKDLTLY
ncbi:MAG: transposase [Desulfuromonadales bacterium]|nr:transposase [Desulfuromonadales bacterium]